MYLLRVLTENNKSIVLYSGNSFQIAKVILIYRKNDPSLVSNYRPVSILPIFSKILERLVYKRLYGFQLQNNFFNENQFGFKKFHSTDLALAHLYDSVKWLG